MTDPKPTYPQEWLDMKVQFSGEAIRKAIAKLTEEDYKALNYAQELGWNEQVTEEVTECAK